MKTVFFVCILAVYSVICISPLDAIVDFTLVDTYDLGRRNINTPLLIGGNRYVSHQMHCLEVYEINSTSVVKIQTLYSVDMLTLFGQPYIANGRVYVLTMLKGVLVYEILPNLTLNLTAEFDLQHSGGHDAYNNFIWASGDTLVVGSQSLSYSEPEDHRDYFDVYDISNLQSPEFLVRHNLTIPNELTGIIETNNGYYINSAINGVFYTPSLLSFQEVNVMQNFPPNTMILNSFFYMGKFHYITLSNSGVQIIRCTSQQNDNLSIDWMINFPEFWSGYCYVAEPNRVSIMGLNQDIEYVVKTFIPSETTWEAEYSRLWSGNTIIRLDNGYIGGGSGKAVFYDQQLLPQYEIFSNPYQRAIRLIGNRWMMFKGLEDNGIETLNFYDLQLRQWVNSNPIKYDLIFTYREGSDYLCLANWTDIEVIHFLADGSVQSNMYNLSNYCYELDVWDDKMAVIHQVGTQYAASVYDISTGSAIALGSLTLGLVYPCDIMFYDASHFVIGSKTVPPYADFYRIEQSGAITHLASINTVNYDCLYVHGNKILTGRAEGAIIDVSNPDNPYISNYTDLMRFTTYGVYFSYDGSNNYLCSDAELWLSYITDSNFQVYDYYISCYSFYKSQNRIILQSPTCLLEVEHPEYSSTDDPTTPLAISPLGLPYPNPFQERVNLELDLKEDGFSNLEIYNLKGQKVKKLCNAYLIKGQQSFSWDGKDEYGNQSAAGMYIVRLKVGGHNYCRKMVLLK